MFCARFGYFPHDWWSLFFSSENWELPIEIMIETAVCVALGSKTRRLFPGGDRMHGSCPRPWMKPAPAGAAQRSLAGPAVSAAGDGQGAALPGGHRAGHGAGATQGCPRWPATWRWDAGGAQPGCSRVAWLLRGLVCAHFGALTASAQRNARGVHCAFPI